MKILIISHEYLPYPGGIGRYVHQLSLAASRLGHFVDVLVPRYNLDRSCAREHPNDHLSIFRFSGAKYGAKALLPHLSRCWIEGRSRRYDVIHAADWPSVSCLAFVNRFASIPFWATAHGSEILKLRTSKQARLLMAQGAFEKAEKVLTNSQFTRSLLLSRSKGIDPSRVHVTPLGVSEFWFVEPSEDLTGILARMGIPIGKTLLLTAGRLDPHKGHALVMNALDQLPAEIRKNLVYIVAGADSHHRYRSALEERAGTCNVPVVFTGRVSDEDLRCLYRLADLFLMPGVPRDDGVEGFGLVYLEAAAQGTASLATNFAARPEVILNEQTGILVDPNDLHGLTAALANLLSTPDRLTQLGINAKHAAKNFTWERCAQLTYGLA